MNIYECCCRNSELSSPSEGRKEFRDSEVRRLVNIQVAVDRAKFRRSGVVGALWRVPVREWSAA